MMKMRDLSIGAGLLHFILFVVSAVLLGTGEAPITGAIGLFIWLGIQIATTPPGKTAKSK